MELFALVAVLSAVTQKLVERIRVAWNEATGLPALDGTLVTITAAAVGGLLAWVLNVNVAEAMLAEFQSVVGGAARDLPVFADYVLSGVVIAGGSGLVADLLDRNG